MIGVVRFLFLLALGCWLGAIVFFSFVVAPSLFGTLDPQTAGMAVSAIFPQYYALGMAAASLALAGALVLWRRGAARGRWRAAAGALAVGLVATAWAGGVVQPRAQRLRVAAHAAGRMAGEDPAFRDAHRRAIVLNAAALVAALVGLACGAAALRE